MHRALPGSVLLLGLLIAAVSSGGCVALYTLSEAADPPPSGPGGDPRAGLPLFPPEASAPTPDSTPIATGTPPSWASDGAPYVPSPSEPPTVTETPWTWTPTPTPVDLPETALPPVPSPSETRSLTTPTPDPTPTDEVPVDDDMPDRDEVYHPIVTAMPL